MPISARSRLAFGPRRAGGSKLRPRPRFPLRCLQGRRPPRSFTGGAVFFQSIENFHRWLGATAEKRTAGRAITGACNLGFLVLILSGPFLGCRADVRGRTSGISLCFEAASLGAGFWHNVVVIWCGVPLLVIVSSGVVMSEARCRLKASVRDPARTHKPFSSYNAGRRLRNVAALPPHR